jgi:ABC-type multidrug transport system fused ATPase/permease subunit
MLLMDSPVMIFDEPSANLDSVSENLLWQELFPILKMHSVLWITHRLVNMEEIDEILFLNDGSIIERGTHKELLKMQGFYFKMWNIQNRILIDKDGPIG